jgi:hypothetical protein
MHELDWQFGSVFPRERAAALHEWAAFDAIVCAIVLSAASGRFSWEPARDARLRPCHRASFVFDVPPNVYDAFFNSPHGYRAQYARGERIGEAANRMLLDQMEGTVTSHVFGSLGAVHPHVLNSLHGDAAKIWIDELEVDEQLGDAPGLAYEPWVFDNPDGQGLRAPVGTLLEIKGGWIEPGGTERLDPTKANRSYRLFKTGFR